MRRNPTYPFFGPPPPFIHGGFSYTALNGLRQQWGYIGGGLNGGTWAYERASGSDDQLTYGDWRVVVGWESTPALEPGMPFARGRKIGVEMGYVFSREFEFKSDLPTIQLADTWMLRGTVSF